VIRSISSWRRVAGAAALVLLTACGGGGGDGGGTGGAGGSTPPPTGQQPPAATPLSAWKIAANSPTSETPSQFITIPFKAAGVGTATQVTWNFGDGSPEVLGGVDVQHAFEKSGDFVVTAIVAGQGGDQLTVTLPVTIWPTRQTLYIQQSADPLVPILAGARVRFAASTTLTPGIMAGQAPAGMTYRWAFSDGITGASSAMVRRFDKPGSYELTLTGTDRFGRDIKASRTVVVTAAVTPTMLQTNLGGPGSMNYGPLSLLGRPEGLVRDKAGNVFILDTGNKVIRKITPDGVWSDFVGASGIAGLMDGTGPDARLTGGPYGPLAIDANDTLYFADAGHLRTVSPKGEVVTMDRLTLFGGDAEAANRNSLYVTGLAIGPDGALYLTSQRRVLRVKDGRMTVYAGSDEGARAWTDGPVATARFDELTAIAVRPDGEVLVADSCYGVRKIGTDGQVRTLVRFAQSWQMPSGNGGCNPFSGHGMAMTADGGTLLLWEDSLRVIDKNDAVRTVAATGINGTAVVPVDASTAWVSASWLGTVDWVSLGNGTHNTALGRPANTNEAIVPFAGTGTDGVQPGGSIALDPDGTAVFVVQGEIHRYFPSSHSSLRQTTRGSAALVDGPSGNAGIAYATMLATDAAGNIFFVDHSTALRRIAASDRSVRTIAGSLAWGTADGTGTAAKFSNISGLAVAPDGVAYVVDDYARLVRVSTSGEAVTLLTLPDRSATNIAVTPSGKLLMTRGFRVHSLEADNTLKAIGGSVDTNPPRASRLFGSCPPLLVSPDGKVYVIDQSPQVGSLVIRRLESDGTFTDMAQDGPMAMKLSINRDPLELSFSFRAAAFRADGQLMLWAGQPHSWWLLDGLR